MTRPAAPPAGGLPGRLLVLTDRLACARPLAEVVEAAVDGGAPVVVLREKDLPTAERARLADDVRAVLGDAVLVLAGTSLPGDALHLSAADELPSPRPQLVGRSCHDAQELAAAASCDWVTVSPVWATSSKPDYGPALAPTGLAALLRAGPPALLRAGPPAYALGGVDSPERAGVCRAAGAHGVAVMGAVMRAARPDRVVSDLLRALAEP